MFPVFSLWRKSTNILTREAKENVWAWKTWAPLPALAQAVHQPRLVQSMVLAEPFPVQKCRSSNWIEAKTVPIQRRVPSAYYKSNFVPVLSTSQQPCKTDFIILTS